MNRLRVLLSVCSDLVTAWLRERKAEVDRTAKTINDNEYWRGYGDGVRDHHDIEAAERRDTASGKRQPYPNE